MKFGKVDHIDEIKFTLPPDHKDMEAMWRNHQSTKGDLKIFLGGTMWTIPKWVGKIYPKGTKAANFVQAYGQQFGTIELNATHYRTPTLATVKAWHDAMPDDFIFSPKFPQGISHYRRFNNCEVLTDDFLMAIDGFGKKLSHSFIQLPPNYKSDKNEALLRYLESLPTDLKCAVEFRHESWFTEDTPSRETWEFLRQRNIATVITDTAGRRDALHMNLTTPVLIMRFGGYYPHKTDALRMKQWVARLKEWKEKGLQEIHLWMHQPESIMTPESLIEWESALQKGLGVKAKRPQITGTLFD